MKKLQLFKKAAAISLSLVMASVTAVGSPAFSACAKTPDNVVSPQNIVIVQTYNNLNLGSLGKLTCEGATAVQSGYQAEVIVTLQRYENGSWTPKQTWYSGTAYDFASIYETYYVTRGEYRLKTTHRSYSSNGSVLDNFDKYSNIIVY